MKSPILEAVKNPLQSTQNTVDQNFLLDFAMAPLRNYPKTSWIYRPMKNAIMKLIFNGARNTIQIEADFYIRYFIGLTVIKKRVFLLAFVACARST